MSTKYAIVGGKLIDGTGAEPVENSLVLVDDNGKIEYAGVMQDLPEGVEVIDAAGKTVLPGLIDTHLHFSGNLTDDDTDWVMQPLLEKQAVAVKQAYDCLTHGLTTVCEIGRFGIQIRDCIDKGVFKGPRVLATGLGCCRAAGHGDSHHGSQELNKESHPWGDQGDGPWDLRKAVRRRRLPGLEWLRAVKLYTILGADVYLFPTLIALGFATYVIFLNFRGASSAAKLQAFLTKALLCGMLLAMGVSLFTGSPDNAMPVFSQVTGAGGGKPATEGTSLFAGIVSVLVLTPFFYAGFDTIPQQAEEAAEGLNWNKFGKIISLALLAAGGFYMVCIYSFGTILDWHEFVKSPVPALACLKGINMLLYLAMLVIATLGPMGPMNSFYGTSRIMLAMGRKGQLPEKFAEVDPKSGAPKLACVVLGVITVVGPFLDKNMLIPLTNVSARLHLLLRHGRPRLPAHALHRFRPASSLRGARRQVWHQPAIVACGTIIGLLVIPVLSRLPQHGGVEHRDRLAGCWPGPHGLHQFPQKITPSRDGSGCVYSLSRAPNPAPLG